MTISQTHGRDFTCFVISPIGDKGSDVRRMADELLDLIIEPALDKFNFTITRADKISNVSSITTDIITHIQNSDLCVIDVTGLNSNVMYECGRRHETGKPYIMLANEGEKLPFDINGIRTIFYSLKSPKEVREAQIAIQEIIKYLVVDGFTPHSSGESLSSISDALKRIERKLDFTETNKYPYQNPSLVNSRAEAIEDLLRQLSPKELFTLAIKDKNITVAEQLLPMFSETIHYDTYQERYLLPLAAIGSNLAAQEIIQNLNNITNLTTQKQLHALSSLANYFISREKHEQGIETISPIIDSIIANPDTDNKSIAQLLNQKQRLYVGNNLKKAIEIGEQVIKLDPSEAAYHYNLALDYWYLNDETEATIEYLNKGIERIEQAMILREKNNEVQSADYLLLGIRLYKVKGDNKRHNQLLTILNKVNPLKIRLLES